MSDLLMGVLGGKVSAPWSPLSDPDLLLWLDFSNQTPNLLYQDTGTSTPVTANNDPIGDVRDRSNHGYHHTQATSGNKPLWKSNIQNGLGMALGDGISKNLNLGFAICDVTKITLIAVVRTVRTSFPGPGTVLDTVWGSASAGGGTAYGMETYNGFNNTTKNQFVPEQMQNLNQVNGTPGTFIITLGTAAASFIVGGTHSANPSGNVGSRVFDYTDASHPGNVLVGELILINRTFAADADFSDPVTYCNNKWVVF